MTAPPDHAIAEAAEAAVCSPCAKSKRGVAIFSRAGLQVYATGWNHQPQPFMCTGSESCRKHCDKLCVHAESDAIGELRGHLGFSSAVGGVELVHVKVVDGAVVPGGGPSCWQCSREILAAGIGGVWLYEFVGDGTDVGEWKHYTAEEFHRETIKNCEIAR